MTEVNENIINDRENMILSKRPMVYWHAKKIKTQDVDILIEAGMDALLKAVETYQGKDGDFSVYVYKKIKGSMIAALEKHSTPSLFTETDTVTAISDEWNIELEEALALQPKDEAVLVSDSFAGSRANPTGFLRKVIVRLKKVAGKTESVRL